MKHLTALKGNMKLCLALAVIFYFVIGTDARAFSSDSFTDVTSATGGTPGNFNVSATGSAPGEPSPVEDLIRKLPPNVTWDGHSSRFIKVTGADPSSVYASAWNTTSDLLSRENDSLERTRQQIKHLQKTGKTAQDKEIQDALQRYYEGEQRRQWIENERLLLILARLSQDLEKDHAATLPGVMMYMIEQEARYDPEEEPYE